MPYKDPEKRKANRRQWKNKNREKLQKEQKAYYAKNKEKILEQSKILRDKKRGHPISVLTEEEKEQRRKAKKKAYRVRNKEKIQAYYVKNKEKIREQSKIYREKKRDINWKPRKLLTEEERKQHKKDSYRRTRKKAYAKNKQFVWEYKSTHPCAKCGESHPACLVFHHLDPKEKEANISHLLKRGLSRIKKEIAKCMVLCANCHSKLHYLEKGDTLDRR